MVDNFTVATKALIERNGKILILKESRKYEEGTNAEKWHIPGGRMEHGERFSEALRRELKEEADLEVEIGDPYEVDEWRPEIKGEKWQIIGIFFRCRAKSEKVELGNEHSEFKWIIPKNHREYNMVENVHQIFESLTD